MMLSESEDAIEPMHVVIHFPIPERINPLISPVSEANNPPH